MEDKYTDINKTFNRIISEIKDIWLMSDILEIPPTNDKKKLFEEFKKKFGVIFTFKQPERYQLGMELNDRVEIVKNRIGEKHKNWYKGIYVIKSIPEYMQVLSQIRKREGDKELWYRGQLDAKFNLRPNIHRNAKEISTGYDISVKPKFISWHARGQEVAYPNIRKMLDEFKEKAKDFVKFEVNNDFEWMFLAQHYGMLTPLLDWTEDPLVGLFFAMDGLSPDKKYELNKELNEYKQYGRISEAAAIYILDPGKLNEKSDFYYKDEDGNKFAINHPIKITDNNYDVFSKYIDGEAICPLCIKAPKREYRICRQSGNFVCQGTNIQTIDSVLVCREILYKIYIPYAMIKKIQNELKILNITSDSIYGEESYLDQCGKEARLNEEQRFKTLIDKLNEKFLSDDMDS